MTCPDGISLSSLTAGPPNHKGRWVGWYGGPSLLSTRWLNSKEPFSQGSTLPCAGHACNGDFPLYDESLLEENHDYQDTRTLKVVVCINISNLALSVNVLDNHMGHGGLLQHTAHAAPLARVITNLPDQCLYSNSSFLLSPCSCTYMHQPRRSALYADTAQLRIKRVPCSFALSHILLSL